MHLSRRVFVAVLLCLSIFHPLGFATEQDEVIAERVLGSEWKQLSRRAGMIFAGTVLNAPTLNATTQTVPIQPEAINVAVSAGPPAVLLSFRVDLAIAGVEPGQILTIHEWVGAWSMQRTMHSGDHILIFLYPLSHLGLTSPVGGSLGQVDLDASGKNVSEHERRLSWSSRNGSSRPPVDDANISLAQLERAIRRARLE
jgi:hypothetical protein